MAGIKGIMILVKFLMIMKLNAAYPLLSFNSVENTVNRLSKLELNHIGKPSDILENEINLKFDTNELGSGEFVDLTVPNEQNKIIKQKHTPESTSDQVLPLFSKIFIRDSAEVFQNRLKNSKTTEYSLILEKIKNIGKEDVTLVGQALYNAFELTNDVNTDYEISQSTAAWLELILERFRQFMKEMESGTSPNDAYENFSIVGDIENNLEAIKLFWLNF
ncbi:uncharacterized protein LOC110118717 [Ceratitis capitata]|uniref:(Mediterranean fruit fly) hypothetical protein n=1 Tax=Ceratitis capitata TaxID=7213 RepID=A0A811UIP6_CERCA|nr:uncharacterized protein LOC110118717 [Ceratitis capitata]CAD6997717.1 unnamed protein product [Ceratitis capitata]